MKRWELFVAVILMGATSGCLVTRDEVRETIKNEPLSPEQQSRINAENKYQDLEDQSRHMLGRIETLENSVNLLSADKNSSRTQEANEKKALHEKLKIYEESIAKLEAQQLSMSQRIEALQAASTKDTKSSGKGSFEAGDGDFEKKHWKEAITSFDTYRSKYPTGKRYAEATYKIGVSFGELGMKSEAKTFFSEVVDKFPKSEWAKKAKLRLKALK